MQVRAFERYIALKQPFQIHDCHCVRCYIRERFSRYRRGENFIICLNIMSASMPYILNSGGLRAV